MTFRERLRAWLVRDLEEKVNQLEAAQGAHRESGDGNEPTDVRLTNAAVKIEGTISKDEKDHAQQVKQDGRNFGVAVATLGVLVVTTSFTIALFCETQRATEAASADATASERAADYAREELAIAKNAAQPRVVAIGANGPSDLFVMDPMDIELRLMNIGGSPAASVAVDAFYVTRKRLAVRSINPEPFYEACGKEGPIWSLWSYDAMGKGDFTVIKIDQETSIYLTLRNITQEQIDWFNLGDYEIGIAGTIRAFSPDSDTPTISLFCVRYYRDGQAGPGRSGGWWSLPPAMAHTCFKD